MSVRLTPGDLSVVFDGRRPLIVFRNCRQKNDRLHLFETMNPFSTFSFLTSNVDNSEFNAFSSIGNVENVFDDSCRHLKVITYYLLLMVKIV